ncbi:Kae1-associated serine/threonine protein kinase [Candidatus Woesearchaeota archaeon]|nr:Kae1-associated serine/threonine protein kinase [Candidatus Woesearchaeota archaeon]
MKKLIAQGAEAKLFLEDGKILKNRFKKNYRLHELDNKLRGSRTRREAKILEKLETINFPSPRITKNDEKENLAMEKIEGKLVKDTLEKSDYKKLCQEIGKKVAVLHNNLIIHGDLTTSNMILSAASERSETRSQLTEVYFIDFGLSFFSEKAEDKAVDLHLLKEALESKHYRIGEECFKCALDAYRKEAKKSHETIKRLEAVEKRGKYRAKRGS